MPRSALCLAVLSLWLSLVATGCEESKDSASKESAGAANTAEKPGPISGFSNQGVGSAPGNARRSIENTLNKAQQEQSRQFGEIFDDE